MPLPGRYSKSGSRATSQAVPVNDDESPRPDPDDWSSIVAAIRVADDEQRMSLSWREVIGFMQRATPEQMQQVVRDVHDDPRVADAVAETILEPQQAVDLLGRKCVEVTARRWLNDSDRNDIDGWAIFVAEVVNMLDLDDPESVERFRRGSA